MSRVIYAKHEPYEDGRLGEVGLDMDHAGAPTIRVREIDDSFYALEGSHRLVQAHVRGVLPKLIVVEPDLPEYAAATPAMLPRYEFPHVYVLRERDFL